MHLHIIFERMRQAGLTIQPDKVHLASPVINLLEFVVDNGTLRPNEDKLRAITEYPPLHDAKSLQRYLGMIAFYRDFIPQCAEITEPLNRLLRKKTKWCLGQQQQTAFSCVSRAVTENACLNLPDLNRPFILQTDTSDYRLGAVRLQEHDSVLRPIAFASHTLTEVERNYSTTQKECLEIIFALKKFDMYLDGASFWIQTDHIALSWLKGLQNPAGRLAQWAFSLQRYKYTIEYKRGVANHVSDALSRAPLLGQEMQVDPDLVALANAAPIAPDSRWETLMSREELRAAQQSDGLCQKVMNQLAEENTAEAGNPRY